ncbi:MULTISPECIES: hypothetical protein [Frankia]|uniref:hypothetical protein n=1 Tax=Frankia TaxID=1854 RepID=UPI000A02D9EF|nr:MULTISPECIES: hypothetical protein [Frankia]
MSASGGSDGGLLGNRAVAFWAVVTGILAVVTFSVGVATRLTAGPDGPTPTPSISSPTSPTPSPTPTRSPSPAPSPSGDPSGGDSSPTVRTTSPRPFVTTDGRLASPSRPSDGTALDNPRPLQYTFAGASQYPCSSEGRIRSLFQAPAQLVVDNRSSQIIQLYYLDATGNRIAQTTLASGRSVSIRSHLGDAWLPATGQADCIGIFALRGPGRIQIFDAR